MKSNTLIETINHTLRQIESDHSLTEKYRTAHAVFEEDKSHVLY